MTTSAVRLTETAINKAIRDAKLGSAAQIDLSDPDQRGLVLRIGKTGYAAWNLVCKSTEGKFVRRIIGGYPAISLSAARAKARSLREAIRQGNVPATRTAVLSEAREREQSKKEQPTFEILFDMYEAHIKSSNKGIKSWPEARKRLSSMFRDAMPLPLEDVTLNKLQGIIDRHGLKSSTSAAWGMRTIRPILKWASAPGRALLPRDMMFLDYGSGVARRERILTSDELVYVLLAMKRLEGHPYVDCMKFIMLTLLRRSEAVYVRWQDITFGDEPFVRIADTKNGLDHKLPLSRQATHLLLTRRSSAEKIEIQGGGMLRGVRPVDLVFFNGAGGALANWHKAQTFINEASKTEGWQRHDLRRTGATLLGEMGVEPYIVEAALNHTSIHSALAATYNQSRYRRQVADALQRLADHLDKLVGDRP
jgi:integrase